MNTSPDAIFSKQMLREVFKCSQNRLYVAAEQITKHEAYIENGNNPLAPLWAWCEVLKTVPKNPRPYRPKGGSR